ncbi:hypothetical protein CP532_2020 [Ophiocordyceps camponoti-leonardi (nom. inval.)]|nr:hypothetical protein CP532_2020 [Ophiocordyceps camponoti-leonardi (nom. inval.)]
MPSTMPSPRTTTVLSLLAAAVSVTAASVSNSSVRWTACADNMGSPLPVDCARMTVPLDYTEPARGGLELELLRVPAVTQPAQGSILLNFGGPGQPGRQNLALVSAVLQALSGGRFNLVAFDPRGTVNTLPFTCYDPVFWQQNFWQDPIFPVRDDPRGPETELGRLWARGSALADVCARKHNDTGRLISTAFVVRDLVRVAEALDDDGLVRYWGFSYGTTLGATLLSMFPDKVDKVILDGVQNAHDYYNADADFEEWTQSDEVFSGIFTSCAANPDRCALARPGKSAADLEQSVWKLADSLRRRPLAFNTSSFVLDDGTLRGFMSESLYSTSSWPDAMAVMNMLISGPVDEAFVLRHLGDRASLLPDSNSSAIETAMTRTLVATMPLFGIHCLDRTVRKGSLDALMPALRRLLSISRVMGGAGVNSAVVCAQWKLEPRERYAGDFRVRPRAPVLIVGNSHDGHTPIRSAHNLSAGVEGSVVLEVDGYGHTSLGLPSRCMIRTLSAYWRDGKMPAPGTVCGVDAPPFSGITWPDILNSSSSITNTTTTTTTTTTNSSSSTAGRQRGPVKRHAETWRGAEVPTRSWRLL